MPLDRWTLAGYAPRKLGRKAGVQVWLTERFEDKPKPGVRDTGRMVDARDMLLRAAAGEPVGLHRPGMLRFEAARVLVKYGSDDDEKIALPYLPYDERKALLRIRRRRK